MTADDLRAAKAIIERTLRDDEGEVLTPYLCPAGVPTIGVGLTHYPDGRRVRMDDPPITREQSAQMLQAEIERFTSEVLRLVGDAPTTAHQLAALVSLAYNIGLDGLRRSTVLRLHRTGDTEGAARAFALWNRYRPAGPGTPTAVSRGLTARRAREAALYLSPAYPGAARRGADEMPQAVEAETSIARSPIAQSGAVTAAAGVLATVAAVTDHLQQYVPTVDAIGQMTGIDAGLVMGVVLLITGGAAIYWRHRQRREGWA